MADVVWAPWRMTYILSDKPAGCMFCEKPRAQDDTQNLILWRGHTAFVIMNRYPYNNGHLMVVVAACARHSRRTRQHRELALPALQGTASRAHPPKPPC